MIKIAIVTRKMITGGVEKALVSMLKEFENEKVEIDLYVQELGGDLEEEIPEWVHKYELQKVGWKDCVTHLGMLIRKICILFELNYKKHLYIEQCWLSSKLYKSVEKEYDIAISYHAPNTIPVFYTIDKIKAKKKILWLHGDLGSNGGSTALAIEYYKQFDRIYVVADYIKKEFVKFIPEKKDAIEIFHNFFYPEQIIKKAKNGVSYTDNYEGIRILSIGRISNQKGYDMAVNVCQRLKANGFDFRWYICGDGEEREKIENLINTKSLKNYMVLLGNQVNPYGYLRDCDLYVQTSRYEGYCTTTNEAKVLNKPVITTDVSGAREQFVNDETGWIVDINEDAIYQKLKEILSNMEICQTIVKNLENNNQFANQDIQTIFNIL